MNLGGYDKNDFNESKGNEILKKFLQKDELFFCNFNAQDTIPNLDGYFEILEKCNSKNIPVGKVEVQIKTLNSDYSNDNKFENCSQYKYSCDTKIFNVVKCATTLNPCYLFMVDTNNNRIFAKYISLEYVLELDLNDENNKTIYFNDTDELTNVYDYYKIVKNIYSSRANELTNSNSNKFITRNNLSDEELTNIQNEFDYLNNIFDNELNFLKIKLFPNVWKFGIAYLKDKDSIGVGIYRICKGKNGEYFKALNNETSKECNFISVKYQEKDNIRNHINKFIKSLLEKAYKENIIPLNYVSNEILFEIIYYFLDEIASIEKSLSNPERPYTYYKDLENIDIIESYYNSLKMYEHIKHKDIFNRVYKQQTEGYFLSDPFGAISHGSDLSENKKIICDLLKNPLQYNFDTSKIILKGQFEYSIIEDTIIELKNRNIENIQRIWKSKNWLDFENRQATGIHRIENGFEISDYFYNLKLLINQLPTQYNSFIKNFMTFGEKLNIKNKYIYGFSNDEEFSVKYEKYSNDSFVIEIDDSILANSFEECLKKDNFLSVTNSGCAHVFSLHFPLLTHLNYLFINQLSSIYGIEDINFTKDYYRLI